MVTVRQDDVVDSVAEALQYISHYHPADFIKALGEAYEREESPAAKDAMAQILVNSRMSAEGRRPICQDTGIVVVVFVDVGMDVRWDADSGVGLEDMVNEGVRRAYTHPGQRALRASSSIRPPTSARTNTRDNTPAVIHMRQSSPATRWSVARRRQGRGLGEQGALRSHAQSQRQRRGLGAEDRSPPWAPAGAPRASWASASAARRRRRCCWPRNPCWQPIDLPR